jgi:hypothetical protein
MSDRLLFAAWNGLILGLVVVLGAASLAMTYLALLKLVSKRLDQGVVPLVAGVGLAGAAYLLARHKHDLVGRE